MKNGNSILYVIASTGLLSLMPIVAIAGSSTPVTLEKKVQENAERQLAVEGKNILELFYLPGIGKIS